MKHTNGTATKAIHAGQVPDHTTGAITTPIIQSTTYVQQAVGTHKGYTYSRAHNPTVTALEEALGALEDSLPAVCFSSGMAAIHALLLATLKAGDHVICGNAVYGGTVRLLREFFSKLGVSTTFVDSSSTDGISKAITPNTALVLIETPANPTLQLTDIAAVATLTRSKGILLAVDNTFLTPVGQRCLELGADVTIYSTTKLIEGHDSTIGGALLTNSLTLRDRFDFTRKSVGSIQKPQEAWLTLRGLKTLPVRLKTQSENAQVIANWLAKQESVSAVHFPYLDSFPQLELAKRQQLVSGNMISFELRGGLESGSQLMNSVRLCSLAENLGAVETLITHPVTMTHGDVPVAQRLESGITDGLIRLSVGLEEPEDIIADIEQALASCCCREELHV